MQDAVVCGSMGLLATLFPVTGLTGLTVSDWPDVRSVVSPGVRRSWVWHMHERVDCESVLCEYHGKAARNGTCDVVTGDSDYINIDGNGALAAFEDDR